MKIKNKTRKVFINVVFAFITSLLLAHTIFLENFLTARPITTIFIEDTATKNAASAGTDVRIKSIEINDEKILLDQFKRNDEWIFENNVIMAVNPQEPVALKYTGEKVNTLKIEFQKHLGSGIVRIKENAHVLKEIDLYSESWDEVSIKINLGKVSIIAHKTAFILLYGYLLYLTSIFPEIIYTLKKETNKKGYKVFAFLIVIDIILILSALYYKEVLEGLKYALIGTSVFIGVMGLVEWLKRKKKLYGIQFNGVIALSSAILIFKMVEKINTNINDIGVKYIVGNIWIYLVLILFFYILFRQITFAVFISMLITFIYAVANYFVRLFRGTPIVPGDFFVIGTAKNVFLNYHYELNWNIVLSIWMITIWMMIIIYLRGEHKKDSYRNVLVWTVPVVVLVSGMINMDFFKPALDLWDINSNIKQYGVAMSLLSNIRQMHIAPPEGYEYRNLEILNEQYIDESEKIDNFKPNVIAIMNESFSDLSILSSEINSNEYMEYFNTLEKNVVKGTALVSTIGGGTANTEYEFLTGNSMAFVPGTVPYQQFVLKDSFSLAQIFKERGYSTVGIHPYDKKGYNRYLVYPRLGFDEFIDYTYFENAELIRNRYISDEESYKKVIQQFEEKQLLGKPVFLFNVTMQNHSDYLSGYYGNETVKIPGYEGEFPDAEEYLTLIKESDRALQGLINYFEQIEEPTVVILFGDHQPKLSDEFYDAMAKKSLDLWNLEEKQKQYEVPFFIWANYDIEEKNDIFTSVNYLSEILFDVAGISKTPYQKLQKELQMQVPAMNINGYLDKNGLWHSYTEKIPFELSQYWYIQYNNMFDKIKCKKWFSIN